MKVQVAKDSTHVLITFTAENAIEGYEIGRALEQAKAFGANLPAIAPMIQFSFPKAVPKREELKTTNGETEVSDADDEIPLL